MDMELITSERIISIVPYSFTGHNFWFSLSCACEYSVIQLHFSFRLQL